MSTRPSAYAGDPVVVVGNGPVGQTAALLLARWGVPVVLLDRRSRRDLVGSRAICQQRDVLDVWDSVGAGEQIAAEGLTWTTVRTFYREEELFSYELADNGSAHFPPFVNISQSRSEQILDEQIAAAPLIDVRWGYEVDAISQNGDGVTLHCATPVGARVLSASYAVVAAGSRCDQIREMLGLRFDGVSFSDRFLICDIRADLSGWARERRFYFDPQWNPGRQVLIHPCPDSTFRIDWQVPGDYSPEEDEASGGLAERIRAIVGDQPYEIVWKSVYSFHSRVVDRMQVGRVLLAGDAAHLVAPFGARGLNSGVADAENLAWKIAYSLHGWAGPSIIESYHDERHAAAIENIEVTTATMNFLVPQDEEQWKVRHAVLERALSDVSAHAQVDSGRLAEPFWYTDSPLTTPDQRRPAQGRPPRGTVLNPGPGVILPDGPIYIAESTMRRLRQISRDGLLLLAGPNVDLGELRQTAMRLVSGPLEVLGLHGIDVSGVLDAVLHTGPNEVWVVRPDAHVAAVLPWPDESTLRSALQRLSIERSLRC